MLSWSSFLKSSVQYSFQVTGCFPALPSSKQCTVVRDKEILSQRLSSFLGRNIGRAGDRTIDLLFLSPVRYRLSYVGKATKKKKVHGISISACQQEHVKTLYFMLSGRISRNIGENIF